MIVRPRSVHAQTKYSVNTQHKPYSSGPRLAKLGRRIRRLATSKALEKILGWDPPKATKVGGMLSIYFEEGRRFGLPKETLPSHILSIERIAARLTGNPTSLTSIPIPSTFDRDQAWVLADWALLYERELKNCADQAMHQYWRLKATSEIGTTENQFGSK